PLESGSDVLLLRVQLPDVRELILAAKTGLCVTKSLEEHRAVPLAETVRCAGVRQSLVRILSDRLEEAVPALAGEVAVDANQGLGDERRKKIEDAISRDAVASTHFFGRVERPRSREHGQTVEQLAFTIRQQLVT